MMSEREREREREGGREPGGDDEPELSPFDDISDNGNATHFTDLETRLKIHSAGDKS